MQGLKTEGCHCLGGITEKALSLCFFELFKVVLNTLQWFVVLAGFDVSLLVWSFVNMSI